MAIDLSTLYNAYQNPDQSGNILMQGAGSGTTSSTPQPAPAVGSPQANQYQYQPGTNPNPVAQTTLGQAPAGNAPMVPPSSPAAPGNIPGVPQMPAPGAMPGQPQMMPPAGAPQMPPLGGPVAPGAMPTPGQPNTGALLAQGPTATDVGTPPVNTAMTNAMNPQGPSAPIMPGATPMQATGQPGVAAPVTQTVNATNAGNQPQVNPAQPPAPSAPMWSLDMQTAGNDSTRLHAIAGNKDYPEEARKAAAQKAYEIDSNEQKKIDAQKTLADAAQGNVRAQNQVMNDIRRDDASGSYIKAILLHATGLHELGKNEEQKLGVNSFGQAIVDGEHYTVEKNGQGAITRAWNANGQSANDTQLAKINATSTPLGTHQYNYGAEVYKTPTGELVRSRTNSITGASEFVDSKTGQVWNGQGTPTPLRIETQTEIAQNKANIGINAAAPRAYNQAQGANAGKFNFQNQTNMPVQTMGGGRPTAGIVGGTNARPTPIATGATGAQPATASVRPAVAQPNVPQATAQTAPAVTQPQTNALPSGMTPAQITNMNTAQGQVAKTSAAAVANAGSTENSIHQADKAIKLIESDKHNLGGWIGGTVRGKGPIMQGVGQEVGQTEASNNTKMIMDAVRSLGGAMSQAAIKGHMSNQELQFMTENKPTATSSPEFTKQWLQQAREKLENAGKYAQTQVTGGGTANNPVVNPPAATAPKVTKRFNPASGKVEEIK